jgi:hypothetical protein
MDTKGKMHYLLTIDCYLTFFRFLNKFARSSFPNPNQKLNSTEAEKAKGREHQAKGRNRSEQKVKGMEQKIK